MKKIIIIAAMLVFAAAGISCNKENGTVARKGDRIVLNVGFEEYSATTKTYLNSGHVLWAPSASVDQVLYVFDSEEVKNAFTRTSVGTGNLTATFEGEVSPGATAQYAFFSGKTAEHDHSSISGGVISGTSVEVVNPQKPSNSNSYANSANLAVMKAGDSALKNVFGYIKFHLPAGEAGKSKVKSVTITADEFLTGKVEIDYSGTEPVAGIVSGGGKSLTLNARTSGSPASYPAEDIYAVLPAGTYHNMQITVTPFATEGTASDSPTGTPFTLGAENDVIVVRSKYTDGGTLPYEAPAVDPGDPGEWPTDASAIDENYSIAVLGYEHLGGAAKYTLTENTLVDKVTFGKGIYASDAYMSMSSTLYKNETYGSADGEWFPNQKFISFKICRPGSLSLTHRHTTRLWAVAVLTNKGGSRDVTWVYTGDGTDMASSVTPITSSVLEGITEAATVYIFHINADSGSEFSIKSFSWTPSSPAAAPAASAAGDSFVKGWTLE